MISALNPQVFYCIAENCYVTLTSVSVGSLSNSLKFDLNLPVLMTASLSRYTLHTKSMWHACIGKESTQRCRILNLFYLERGVDGHYCPTMQEKKKKLRSYMQVEEINYYQSWTAVRTGTISEGKKNLLKKVLLTFIGLCLFFPVVQKRERTFLSCTLIVITLDYEDKHNSTDCTVLVFGLELQHRLSVSNEEPFLFGQNRSRPN